MNSILFPKEEIYLPPTIILEDSNVLAALRQAAREIVGIESIFQVAQVYAATAQKP